MTHSSATTQLSTSSPLPPDPSVTPELGAQYGLNAEEYQRMLDIV